MTRETAQKGSREKVLGPGARWGGGARDANDWRSRAAKTCFLGECHYASRRMHCSAGPFRWGLAWSGVFGESLLAVEKWKVTAGELGSVVSDEESDGAARLPAWWWEITRARRAS